MAFCSDTEVPACVTSMTISGGSMSGVGDKQRLMIRCLPVQGWFVQEKAL